MPHHHTYNYLSNVFLSVFISAGVLYSNPNDLENSPSKSSTTEFRSLKSAGVHFKTYNEQLLPDNVISFEIDTHDISKWDFFWASTISFRTNNSAIDDRLCPYLEIPEDEIIKEKLGNGRIRLLIPATPEIVKQVTDHECVVTDKPKISSL